MGPEKEKPLSVEGLAAETERGLDDASGLPNRLDRYSRAHHRALDMSDYARRAGAVKLSGHIAKCGHYLLFRDYFTVGKVRLHAAQFCNKHLLCPLCAIRRGAKAVKAYGDRFHVVTTQEPEYQASLVTLTVKDGGDLSERFRHLQSSFKRMQQARRSYLREKGPFIELVKVGGAVGSYEFKRGAGSGLWHPHLHMVCLHKKPLDQRQLSADWHKYTGDSFIVDVSPLRNDKSSIDAFLEVFKYAIKFSDLPLDDNWEGYQTLSGKRLVFSFGDFRGVEVPEDLNDECLDDLPFVEMLYKFAKGVGYNLQGITDPRGPMPARPEPMRGRTASRP